MVTNAVIFRFSADIQQLTAKIDIMSKKLDQLGIKSRSATAGLNQVGAGATAAGQAATTSAVGIGVMTQGMLNLTTALVQTITSLSNLERVQNRAKASAIAVARAQDLLANKEERLASLRKAGEVSAQKIININREIATAVADITVKTEKLGIEQRAITDIYALFFTNLANVGISTFQTAASLMQIMAARSLSHSAAMIQNTAATGTNTAAVNTNTLSRKLTTPVILGNTLVTKIDTLGRIGNTIAIRVQIGALTALKFALGPIGLILIGITAAMVAYEAVTGGISKAMGLAEADAKSFDQQLQDTRVVMDEVSQSGSTMADTFTLKVSASIRQNIKQFELLKKIIAGTADEFDRLSGGFANKESINFNTINRDVLALGNTTNFRLPDKIGGKAEPTFNGVPLNLPLIPGRFGFLSGIKLFVKDDLKRIQRGEELGPPKPSEATLFEHSPFFNVFLDEFITNQTSKGVPITIAIQLITDEKIQRIAAQTGNVPLGEQIANLSLHEAFVRTFGVLGSATLGPRFDKKNQGFFGVGRQDSLEDEARDQRISVERLIRNLLIEGRPVRSRDLDVRVKQLGRIVNGVAVGGDIEFRAKFFRASNFDIDRPTKTRREIAERIRAIQSIPPNLKLRIRSGEIFGNRLDVIVATAAQGSVFDIGNVAHAISFDDALRIATLERQLGLTGFGSNAERNQSIANAIAFHSQAFITKAQINDQRSTLSRLLRPVANAAGVAAGNRQTNFFGAGFFNSTGVTAAFQVLNVGTPPHILQRIAAQDAYAKSLDSILPQAFAMLINTGNFNVRLNRSQVSTLRNRGRRNVGLGIAALLAPLQPIIKALAAITSSGVSMLTLDEAKLFANIPEVINFINTVGKPRFDFEIDRLRQHDADVERFNERLVAMSSGVGGF